MHVIITLGGDSFNAEGEFTFDAGFAAVFRQWLNAKDETPGKLEDPRAAVGNPVGFIRSRDTGINSAEGVVMPLDLSRLTAAVEKDKTVNDSAVTLLSDLADRVRATAGDPVAVTALADALDAQQDALAAAVVANTPAA